MTQTIRLHGASEHNLAGITVEIPRGRLTVVTGVSGSGKSSLVFDTLHAASERRYLETLSSHARQFLQRMPSPRLGHASGLSPSIALSQRRGGDHARSTVGTLSGLHDLLRFWFARHNGLEARQLSFVSAGACAECRGVGSVDEVSRELLVADPDRTLREGALVPTTPTGYIVYSQVTVDALDTVCRAHGFDVDTPWRELSTEQQDVVFFGSDRVEVPFGKHSLESRMKWEGITAKPRELGHYKGLIPTIADILRRSRNENALRFARSVPCPACGGSRLGETARAAAVDGVRFEQVLRMPFPELLAWCRQHGCEQAARLVRRLEVFARLGLSHLSCERSCASLSGGEHQRLRLGSIATDGLAGVTFVFDEPSIGLHASEESAVLELLLDLRDAGNTVVVVEHSEHALSVADHVIEIGPGAGRDGGRVLHEGPPGARALRRDDEQPLRARRDVEGAARIRVLGARANNLQGVDASFVVARLNVVSGVAGAGKSTLVSEVLAAVARGESLAGRADAVHGLDAIQQVVHVDQDPIGRTPRSNAGTYTGVFDEIRKLFAAEPLARERGFQATTFSFNTKNGGRCPACEGSGREVVGMHGLPSVELVCAACGGRRFREDVLAVRYRGRASILDVLEATVDEALELFENSPKVRSVLQALARVGLGYLTLGQPATTLSGGEAQRVKLAGELARGGDRPGLFVLEEPTIGLHRRDVRKLLVALDALVDRGHTVVVVEHDLDVLRAADHVVDLGPGAGRAGGRLVGEGTPDAISQLHGPTATALQTGAPASARAPRARPTAISLRGVATHSLRDLDVDLPADGLTVVTGVSGSGKSSLVFDTLFGESRARITEHLSGYLQRQLGAGGVRARSLREASGLRPAIALRQRAEAETSADRRATVATAAELHPTLRTVWSRCTDAGLPAAAFSFFRKEGACETCAGLGTVRRCDPELLIDDAAMPLFDGALRAKNKVVRDFGDPGMRHRSLLEAVARARGFDLSRPWRELDAEAQRAVLLGAGDEQFDAVWEHDGAEGDVHRWRAGWPGIAPAIDQEHARRLASGSKTRRADFEELLAEATCPVCDGARLQQASRQLRVAGITLPELCRRSVSEFGAWIAAASLSAREREVAADAFGELLRRVERLTSLGLGHLQLDRSMASLSAGERQRVRLARQLAAPLTDCVYVLDEPTLGLHPSDVDALLAAIRGLVDAGNAVVAVEHDLRVAEAAQHVIEIGPGAGRDGGRVVASAPPAAMPASSRTGRRLQQPRPALRSTPRRPSSGRIEISGAHANHLEDLDVALPVGQLTVVCGVSGSGKSSLLGGVVARSAKAGVAIGCRSIAGLDAFAHVVVDAAARARRSRTSCVATLLGGFDELRKQFAATDAARANGWRAAHFSLHGRSGGACRACSGVGWVRSEFDFLGAGQWLPCDTCEGRRFDDATLAIRWRGLDLAQCLAATVDELLLSLPPRGLARLRGPLQVAADLGLGYLALGQAGDSLSGGEAQRLSLATHLAAAGDGATLFVLDEPTRGLHPDDVDALRVAFDQLLERGHTILAVEHDLSVIADADHVVELGPGAGADGGCVVVHGTPCDVARCESSRTGSALRDN